ncbi:MarR family transcriptional regulator [Streptomyces sp. NPDC046939]|uniref:MarR family winged helix-turn-helix transcriptional regulator n=1 Tax=Streptomyces sp. NPDC046939 TaxID=3155376 RepID=UPI0033F3F8EA
MTGKQEAPSATAAQAAADIWVVVGRLRRKLRSLENLEAFEGGEGEVDLSPGQASVLARLDKIGDATASELAVVENVRPQSMAKTVISLERAGLVERRQDPADGRRQLVSLTRPGRERGQGVRRARQEWLARALQEHGTEEQLRAVITAMKLIDEVTQA